MRTLATRRELHRDTAAEGIDMVEHISILSSLSSIQNLEKNRDSRKLKVALFTVKLQNREI